MIVMVIASYVSALFLLSYPKTEDPLSNEHVTRLRRRRATPRRPLQGLLLGPLTTVHHACMLSEEQSCSSRPRPHLGQYARPKYLQEARCTPQIPATRLAACPRRSMTGRRQQSSKRRTHSALVVPRCAQIALWQAVLAHLGHLVQASL